MMTVVETSTDKKQRVLDPIAVLLVFLSTFPIVIPFLIVQNVRVALRLSNLVALVISSRDPGSRATADTIRCGPGWP